jgi:uncharacterized protein (TIGR03437 family)
LVNGTFAPLTYVSLGQVNFLIPNDVKLGVGTVQVIRNGVFGNIATMTVTPTAPGVFQNAGLGIVTNNSGQLVTVDNPVVLGNYSGIAYTLWLTGLGVTDCSVQSGTASNKVCNALIQPTLTIGGLPATIYYAGLQPQFPGLYQINFIVPSQVATVSSAC